MSDQPAFNGFPQIDANYTMCPNVFFDRIVGFYEPCVVNVVAILIRETLGWLNQHNRGRKVEAELPLSAFVRHGMSQESARKGLRLAAAAGFILQTEPPSAKDPSRYALRWEDPKTQKQAIKEERRAFQARRTKAGGLRDSFTKKTVPKSRVLKSSTPKSRTLENPPPLNKESSNSFAPQVLEEPVDTGVAVGTAASAWPSLAEAERSPWRDRARQELVAIHAGTGLTPKPKLVETRAKSLYELSLKGEKPRTGRKSFAETIRRESSGTP